MTGLSYQAPQRNQQIILYLITRSFSSSHNYPRPYPTTATATATATAATTATLLLPTSSFIYKYVRRGPDCRYHLCPTASIIHAHDLGGLLHHRTTLPQPHHMQCRIGHMPIRTARIRGRRGTGPGRWRVASSGDIQRRRLPAVRRGGPRGDGHVVSRERDRRIGRTVLRAGIHTSILDVKSEHV